MVSETYTRLVDMIFLMSFMLSMVDEKNDTRDVRRIAELVVHES